MTEKSDRVVRLVYLDGYTYAEAAAELGIGAETVKSHIRAWRGEHGFRWASRREILAWLREEDRLFTGLRGSSHG